MGLKAGFITAFPNITLSLLALEEQVGRGLSAGNIITASLLARLVIIIVHEMVHLLERLHNDRFVTFMDEFMPQWRRCQDELNKAPLTYANLGY